MSAQSALILVALDVNDATLDTVAGADADIGFVNVVELGTVVGWVGGPLSSSSSSPQSCIVSISSIS
ncbi:hypothetical protein PC116_g25710 [Phytophthora cactorum]|uniref:Uncharacterized protein n=1 Tax=Phytophthora cactorum TaxID=29920 RepID=A0A8T1JR41_9STRA|nr:hypothetical protein Pcac1_g1403 [Phytophthora cactorum]KAG2877182.1 hypothetical protein PC114_g23789 [Phytophthora cactorum]KAG2893634.1 hypothetical protein PC117_g23733 [Phytophthora cactorum]KAG4225870.1 hypothetical protein PC116_g25710 [Phytophthora cactorum]